MKYDGTPLPNLSRRTKAALGALMLLACAPGCRTEPNGDGGEIVAHKGPHDPVFPMHQSEPAWSRQGLIVYLDAGIVCVRAGGFYSIDPSLAGIWVVDPRTGDKHRVLAGGANPSWSPDGTQLAFAAASIFKTRTDSINTVQLTSCGTSHFPSWSPDGQFIAYESNCEGPAYKTWIMRATGEDQRNISPGSFARREPSWNPDGTHILHIRYPGGGVFGSEVFVMDAMGNNAVRLTHNDASDHDPEYSPDGRRIALASQAFTGLDPLPQVWLMNADGSAPRQLTHHGGSYPSWSPDGTRIVYLREDWRTNTPDNGVLWIINVETGEEYKLLSKWGCPTSVSNETWADLKRRFR